jgi:AraC-like DNA-binding protein
MLLFSDLEWGIWGRARTCRARIDQAFPHFGISFAYDGSLLWVDDDGVERLLMAPVVWLTIPDHHYRYGALAGEHWDQTYVAFGGRQADRWCEAALLDVGASALRVVPIAHPEWWRGEFDALLRDLARGPERQEWAGHRLQGMLLRLASGEAAAAPGEGVSRRRVREWIAGLAELEDLDTDVFTEAARLGLSTAALRRLCTERTGAPPREVIAQHRLARVAVLLRSTDLPIAAIARQQGFVDQAHLGRAFRSRFGMPPARYRRVGALSTLDVEPDLAVLRRTTSSG